MFSYYNPNFDLILIYRMTSIRFYLLPHKDLVLLLALALALALTLTLALALALPILKSLMHSIALMQKQSIL